jgi:hypothetical protein
VAAEVHVEAVCVFGDGRLIGECVALQDPDRSMTLQMSAEQDRFQLICSYTWLKSEVKGHVNPSVITVHGAYSLHR